MLKSTILALLTLIVCHVCTSQNTNPVTWTHSIESTDMDGQYVLVSTAEMDGDWCLYSQFTDPDGPVPTTFNYDDSVTLVGSTEEVSEAISKHSDLFELTTVKFLGQAEFRQYFTTTESTPSISGTLRFMTCDGSRCLPPKEIAFSATL